MRNPMLEMLMPKSSILDQAKGIMNSNNPMMGMVKMMTAGRDPQQVFYDECRKRGVNPQDILNMINKG